MASIFSDSQMERLAQYRRGKKAAQSSGSDFYGDVDAGPVAQLGGPRDVEWNSLFPSADIQQEQSQADVNKRPPVVAPKSLASFLSEGGGAGRSGGRIGGPSGTSAISALAAAAASVPTPPVPTSARQAAGASAAAIASSSGIPTDLANYILDLERQNQELRQHIQFLQDALLHEDKNALGGGRLGELQGDALRGNGGRAGGGSKWTSEEDKKSFLNDVLHQMEIVIQAHRNKTAVEILKHKTEADQARQALKQLRDSIHQEGMELSLAPAVSLMQKKYSATIAKVTRASSPSKGSGAGSPTVSAAEQLRLPDQTQQLLDAISSDVLHRLSTIQEGDDVDALVKTAVSINFEATVDHFTSQLVQCVKDSSDEVEALTSEMKVMKEDFRGQLAASENQRVYLIQKHDLELQALRDELHAYHVASTQDDVQATVQERALDEYTAMLVDARAEAARVRKELEEERNHSAQVCLKLKSALQKRNSEFEQAVVERAEQVLDAKQRQIQVLEASLAELGGRKRKEDKQVQAGEPSISIVATPQTFIPNVVQSFAALRSSQQSNVPSTPHVGRASPVPSSSLLNPQSLGTPAAPKSASMSTPAGGASSAQQFEMDVLRKTQELLGKYSSFSNSLAHSSSLSQNLPTPIR